MNQKDCINLKFSLKIRTIIIAAVMCISVFTATIATVNAASIDEAVLAEADDKYVPLYTTNPEGPLKSSSDSSLQTSKDYAIFYTQTTFLALLVGYLILFKVKGIDHSEKMHRRSKGDKSEE